MFLPLSTYRVDCILADVAREQVALAVGVVCVSFAALFIRLADAPPLVIAAWRLGLASVVIAPFVFTRPEVHVPRPAWRETFLMMAAGAFLAIHFAAWITSLEYTSVATSVVLVTASPIFVSIASLLFFRQRLHKIILTGIAMSVAGGVLISAQNWQLGSRPFEGALLAIGGALAVSGYLIIGQRLMRVTGVLRYVFVVYGTAAILLLLAALILGYSFIGYSGKTYAMMVLLALGPQLVGHSALNWSLRSVSATLVAVAVLGEPVGATLWAFLILGEVPSIVELAGGALILTGIFLAMTAGLPRSQSSKTDRL